MVLNAVTLFPIKMVAHVKGSWPAENLRNGAAFHATNLQGRAVPVHTASSTTGGCRLFYRGTPLVYWWAIQHAWNTFETWHFLPCRTKSADILSAVLPSFVKKGWGIDKDDEQRIKPFVFVCSGASHPSLRVGSGLSNGTLVSTCSLSLHLWILSIRPFTKGYLAELKRRIGMVNPPRWRRLY
ncbi:hypothetical protein ARMGADRAFT_749852 [Armillaria gallica]|uniref:Uncharacterized protein n=1 Tax=Armillaria gallica TaxID=47427 RepID=A0A2H3DKS0_ARMGA|nr:hypothetical protein ARMGADRAFT_749852 [Armillaria gallica]